MKHITPEITKIAFDAVITTIAVVFILGVIGHSHILVNIAMYMIVAVGVLVIGTLFFGRAVGDTGSGTESI